MTSEHQAYVYIQLPGTVEMVPAALLRVQTLPDGTQVGRFRYGNRYLQRVDAIAFDPFNLPLAENLFEFTQIKGIPGAVRDASPDAWGRRVIEHQLERSHADLHEIDYLLHGPQDGAGYLSFGLTVEPPSPKHQYNRTHQLSELIAVMQAIEEGRVVPAHLLHHLNPGTSMGEHVRKPRLKMKILFGSASLPAKTTDAIYSGLNMQRLTWRDAVV
jgi:serine/threonine-protein kinase HipA